MADDPKDQIQVVFKAKDEVTPAMNQIADNSKAPISKITALWTAAGTFIKGAIAGIVASAADHWFQGAVEESQAAQRAMAQLGNSLANVGIDLNGVRPEVDATVEALQRVANVTQKDAVGALEKLVTVSGNYQGSLANLKLVADVAAKGQMSMSDAAEIVGRAMAGNTRGLRQFGITTKDAVQGLEQLRGKVSGAAETDLKTFGGRLREIGVAYDEMKQGVGDAITGNEALAGAMGGVAEMIKSATRWIMENRQSLGDLVTAGVRFLELVAYPLKGWAEIIGGILHYGFMLADRALLELGAGFELFYQRGHFAIGALLVDLGDFVERAGLVLNLFGIKVVEGWGTTLQNVGNQMEVSAIHSRNQITADLATARTEFKREQDAETDQYSISLAERLALRKAAHAKERDEDAKHKKAKGGVQLGSGDGGPGLSSVGSMDGGALSGGTPVVTGGALPAPRIASDWGSFSQQIHEAFAKYREEARSAGDETDSLGESITGLATGAIENFKNSWVVATSAIKGGLPALAGAIIGTARKAVGASAQAKAKETFLDAGKAAAQGFENPIKFVEAAKLFAVAAGYEALSGLLGGGGGGGSSSASGSSGSVSSTSSALSTLPQAPAVLVIQGGFLDMNDPRQRAALGDAIQQLMDGRSLVIQNG